jgi:hypothetical protein
MAGALPGGVSCSLVLEIDSRGTFIQDLEIRRSGDQY